LFSEAGFYWQASERPALTLCWRIIFRETGKAAFAMMLRATVAPLKAELCSRFLFIEHLHPIR
jgi:hypothetical protein